MKYIGIRIASKKTKKTNRSSARKTPISPASSSRVITTNNRRFSVMAVEAPRAIGTSRAVSTTRGSEIPSTPRCQEIPHGPYQSACSTNWNPGSPPANTVNRYTESAKEQRQTDANREQHLVAAGGYQPDDDRGDHRHHDGARSACP